MADSYEMNSEAFNFLAEDLLAVAGKLAPGYELNAVETALALSFAATKALFRISERAGRPEDALKVVQIMNDTALRAAADMIAGEDSHPVRQ